MSQPNLFPTAESACANKVAKLLGCHANRRRTGWTEKLPQRGRHTRNRCPVTWLAYTGRENESPLLMSSKHGIGFVWSNISQARWSVHSDTCLLVTVQRGLAPTKQTYSEFHIVFPLFLRQTVLPTGVYKLLSNPDFRFSVLMMRIQAFAGTTPRRLVNS